MFNKKEATDFSKFDTLIGKNTVLEGSISASGTLRIDGTVNGNIHVDGDIYIGETSKINGNISCNNIVVSGTVQGNITTKEQLRISVSGRLMGDIHAKSLIIDENGIFEGNSKMTTPVEKTDKKEKSEKAKA